MSETVHSARDCPVVDYSVRQPPTLAGSMFAELDGFQDLARPAVWSEESGGYWIFTDHDVILDGLQRPDLWSSSVVTVADPNPGYMWIPIMLDRPAHTQWRRLIGAWFTPSRAKAMVDDMHEWASELITNIRAKGECDFVKEFGQVFPSMVFLKIMGMPRDKLDDFLLWEDMMLHQNSESDPDQSILQKGMAAVQGYFSELIEERRAHPDPQAGDIISAAANWTIDGEPVSDSDLLNCLLLLFMAGLDTVSGESSYAMYHLATHPQDRRRIATEPDLIPNAVEELLRAYPIVQMSRKATRDADFHGCPVKRGDLAHVALSLAGRDERAYPNAREVDLDREGIRHLSFGAGPHLCPGSHVARHELAIMLEIWHKEIPEYELVDRPLEHGNVLGLESLPLRWNPS